MLWPHATVSALYLVLVCVSSVLILLYRCNAVPRGASTQQVGQYSVRLHTTAIYVSSYCWICKAAVCVLILCVCPHTTCSTCGISVLVPHTTCSTCGISVLVLLYIWSIWFLIVQCIWNSQHMPGDNSDIRGVLHGGLGGGEFESL